MARRRTLTDKQIALIKPGKMRIQLSDPELRSCYVRITPSGGRSYAAVARAPDGKQRWTTWSLDTHTIAEARELARAAIKRVQAGLVAVAPLLPQPDSFQAVAENWLQRHVRAKGLRSEYEITRILTRHIYPAFRDREFEALKRSDVTALLDQVEDDSGPRQADTVLTTLRSIMNWHATRTDDYMPPIIRGMGRDDPHARKRTRVLDDDEIRQLWAAAGESGAFGAFIKLLLLTGQRRQKLATMRWDDVTDGVWHVPTEDREKSNGGSLLLPEVAQELIRSQLRIVGNPHVFPGRGDRPFSRHAQRKARLDAVLGIKPWVVHDLRRTSRSLMSRARVPRDIAERILGHAPGGVEATYDRHSYTQEKADALAKLAGLVERILEGGDGENVVELYREA